jgi:hypothetical protein
MEDVSQMTAVFSGGPKNTTAKLGDARSDHGNYE